MSPCPGLCPVAKVFFGPKRDLTGGYRGRWSREAGVRLAGSHTRHRVFSIPPLGCWSIFPKPLEADSDPGPLKLSIHLSGRSTCVLHLVQGADRGENQLWGSQTPTTRPSVPAGAPGSPQRPLLRRLPSTGAGLSGLTVLLPALPQRPLPQEERASAWTALPFCSLPPLPRVMCPLASACSSQACFFLF